MGGGFGLARAGLFRLRHLPLDSRDPGVEESLTAPRSSSPGS